MKQFENVFTTSNYIKLIQWGKIVSITGFAQIAIQILGFVGGIAVIRLLPTKEYAIYILANTMLSTVTLIADGGISTGVTAIGGKVWQNKVMLGATIATGLHLRKKFAAIILVTAIPILTLLLHYHGASWYMSIAVVLSLIPAFFVALSSTLLEIAPRLHQAIVPLQKIEVGTSLGRLFLISMSLFAFPWAFVALLSVGIPQIWSNQRLRKLSAIYADETQKPDADVQKAIIPVVKRILPGAIYYCISGQITIWLISFYGTTAAVAQIGALGRLTMILNVFSTLCTTLVSPRFARLVSDKKLLLTRFVLIQLILFMASSFIISFIYFLPNIALSVLGKSYYNLTTEILLITISGCISMMAGITYSISISRGWVLNPIVNIGGNILTQVILLMILDLSLIRNVLIFSIINSIVAYLMLLGYFLLKVFTLER